MKKRFTILIAMMMLLTAMATNVFASSANNNSKVSPKEWQEWFNGLSKEEQLSVNYEPASSKQLRFTDDDMEWLNWYNSLSKEEQLAVNYVPSQILKVFSANEVSKVNIDDLKLKEEIIKNIAIEFSESSLSDFSDGSADYLIDEKAVDLRQFLKDKRAIKTIKEDKLGRKLSLIDLEIKDIQLEDLNDNYGVTLTVAINFLDGDLKSSLEYFNSIVINKETGLIIAATTNDLSAGTLLNNQVIRSTNDLIELKNYENKNSLTRSYKKNNSYDFENSIKKFEKYVEEINNEQLAHTGQTKIALRRARYSSFSSAQRKTMRTYQDDWFDGFNPNYANFEGYGGDCTNYASQVLYSGCKTMYAKRGSGIAGSNYWFYRSSRDRSSSWTGVNELRSFLLNNSTKGPSGSISSTFGALESGDIIQLGSNGNFYHSIVVYNKGGDPTVTAHTDKYSGYYSSRYGGSPNSKIHIDGYYY